MDYQRGSAYHGLPAPDKDRFFVLPPLRLGDYCALAAVGASPPAALDKFNVDGWNMEMIGAEHSPGFENTAGSLGQTVSIAAGTAHARKMKGDTGKVYCLLGGTASSRRADVGVRPGRRLLQAGQLHHGD